MQAIRPLVAAALFLGACLPANPLADGGEGLPDGGGVDAGPGSDAGQGSGGGPGSDGGQADGGGTDGGAPDAGVDLDGDGLDDAREDALARDYLPYLSLAPSDGCPNSGLLFRARPHPDDPALVYVFYDFLYERDCGLTGHVGDNEGFGITIDPSVPAPRGVTALKAIAHQGTLCQKVTSCGTCAGLAACERSDAGAPILYSSKDKHAGYAVLSTCQPLTACGDSCAFNPVPRVPPLQNAGEPGRPLTRNLTTQGFIRADAGWTQASLFDFDPWHATKEFGTAGNVAGDLTDPSFMPPACR